MVKTKTKDDKDRIVLQIYCENQEQKERIERAAAAEGRSLSNFGLRHLLKIADLQEEVA